MKHLLPEITHQSSSTSELFVNCIYDISREVLQEEEKYCSLKRYTMKQMVALFMLTKQSTVELVQ